MQGGRAPFGNLTRVNILEAVLLGAVEGFTEFLPVSSTGHLTVLERLLGYKTDDPDITAFTAIIQIGAVLATLLYFRTDFARLIAALVRGALRVEARKDPDYAMAWAVIIGCIPIGIVGLLFKDTIETTLRTLWFVGGALIVWSGAMWYADRTGRQDRGEKDLTWRDTLIIGTVQCLALIPGVSRSGATMTAGLMRGLDRVTVTRLSFMLSVPALGAAGALQLVSEFDAITNGVGWPATLVATAVSFVVAYIAVAWLLKFVAKHDYSLFIRYRIVLGVVLIGLLSFGVISAT